MWSVAPVFSFLLVSAFLVYNHHSKKHQPTFLNGSSNRFVPNVASRDNDAPLPWAGAFIELPNNDKKFETNGASFITPLGWDGHGFSISVGIGGSPICPSSTAGLAAGVRVLVNGAVVSYEAWSTWADVGTSDSFNTSAGDMILVGVVVTSETSGNYSVLNMATNQQWKGGWSGMNTTICQQSAQWGVGALNSSDDPPTASFGTVALVAQAQLENPNDGTLNPGSGSYINNIMYKNLPFTNVWVGDPVVVITTDQTSFL